MKKKTLISIDIFCQRHNLESALIISMHDFGLITILFENEKGFIAEDDLGIVQKIISFHNDLEINKEGIEVILRLLEQINGNLTEITTLKNRLRLYEHER